MTSPIIVGSGLAGMLAANMLSKLSPRVLERQPSLPNNHSAVLRFRTNDVAEVLGIPFRKVRMMKAALSWRNPVADALAYSDKNTGVYRSDRSITAGVVHEDRYIAPPDLIQQMANGLQIEYSTEVNFSSRLSHTLQPGGLRSSDLIQAETPIISTIPMPILAEQLGFPFRHSMNFVYTHGESLLATVQDCDAYISLLVPAPALPFSRISITGRSLIVEGQGLREDDIETAIHLLGIEGSRVRDLRLVKMKYFKIAPIDDELRREFIHWTTDQFNIFALGRFATWRPGLLLDDLVKDVRMIERWMRRRDRYDIAKAANQGR